MSLKDRTGVKKSEFIFLQNSHLNQLVSDILSVLMSLQENVPPYSSENSSNKNASNIDLELYNKRIKRNWNNNTLFMFNLNFIYLDFQVMADYQFPG